MSNRSSFERDEDTSTKYRGLIQGRLVAVLGTICLSKPSEKPAEDRGWTWKGVFEWDKKICLPTFTAELDFLIE